MDVDWDFLNRNTHLFPSKRLDHISLLFFPACSYTSKSGDCVRMSYLINISEFLHPNKRRPYEVIMLGQPTWNLESCFCSSLEMTLEGQSIKPTVTACQFHRWCDPAVCSGPGHQESQSSGPMATSLLPVPMSLYLSSTLWISAAILK